MIGANLSAGWVLPRLELTPVLADAADLPTIIQGGGTMAVIALLIYGIKLLKDGTLRLEREVLAETKLRQDSEARAKEGEARATAAEKRAFEAEDRAEAAEKRAGVISDEVRTALTPEVLRLSGEAARMVEAGAHNAEMMSQLITALLPKAKP